MSQGGSFLDGFEDGAFSGAVGGAIGGTAFAGLGVAGSALGKEISCVSKLGKVIKATAAVSKVLSLGMAGFDMISLADMAIDNKNNPIADLNKKLHSNKAYNVFQISVSALAVFTGGMTTTMKCFVAGTLVLTIDGLRKIEDIEVGDRVLAADTDTMERKYKEVLDTFVRKTNDLIHIFIGEEEIVTTTDHPFWVKGKGFVPAMNLVIGSELINDNGHAICVENILRESSHDGVEVFNFKVEDYHTYYVGESCILVHNADYDTELISKNIKSKVANDEIDPPTERGRAPKSKKDGYSIEIHHDEQNPNGPFKEMTRTDHRLGVNYKKNHPNHTQKSKIDRTQWKYQQRKYWENEWDNGRWNIK